MLSVTKKLVSMYMNLYITFLDYFTNCCETGLPEERNLKYFCFHMVKTVIFLFYVGFIFLSICFRLSGLVLIVQFTLQAVMYQILGEGIDLCFGLNEFQIILQST